MSDILKEPAVREAMQLAGRGMSGGWKVDMCDALKILANALTRLAQERIDEAHLHALDMQTLKHATSTIGRRLSKAEQALTAERKKVAGLEHTLAGLYLASRREGWEKGPSLSEAQGRAEDYFSDKEQQRGDSAERIAWNIWLGDKPAQEGGANGPA